MAKAIADSVNRAGDLAAHYGGEAFAVILPKTDAAGAATIAERIRAAVAAIGLPHAASKVAAFVTISVGVATIRSKRPGQSTELIAAADRALYQSKDSGRNRVVSEAQALAAQEQ